MRKTILLITGMIIILSNMGFAAWWDDPATYQSYDEFNDASINFSQISFMVEGVGYPTDPTTKWAEDFGFLRAVNGTGGASAMSLNDTTAGVGENGNIKGVNFTFAIRQNADSDGNNVAVVVSNSRNYEANKSYNADGLPLFIMNDVNNNTIWYNLTGEWVGDNLLFYINGAYKGTFTFLTGATYYLRFDHQGGGGAPSDYNIDWIRIQSAPTSVINVFWADNQPLNDTIHNTDVDFNFDVTEIGLTADNCSLFNDNGTIGTITMVTASNSIRYNLTDDGQYVFWVECYSTTNEVFFSEINKTIIIDRDSPIITWNNPSDDNSTVMQTGSNVFNISVYDPNLFRINISCWRQQDNFILFNNYTEQYNLSTTFLFTESIQVNEPGNYTCEVEATDSHTALAIPDIKNSKTYNSLTFDNIRITLLDSPLSTETTKLFDRYTMKFITTAQKDGKIKRYSLKVENLAGHPIISIDNSKYSGHLISDDKWIDFEPYRVEKIKVSKNEFLINLETTDTVLDFKSIGILNNVTENRDFSAIGSIDTSPAHNKTGTYYLFGNLSTDLGITEVRWNLTDPAGTKIIDNQNSSTFDGITWNSTSFLLTTEGTYFWTVEAYSGGMLWANGSGSMEINLTNITASIIIDDESCTTPKYRFSAFDEVNRGITNISIRTQFIIRKGISPESYNTTVDVVSENSNSVTLCLDSPETTTYWVTAFIEYWGDIENGTYSTSEHYLNNVQSTDDDSINYSMGLLPINQSTLILLKVQDKTQTPLKGYTVYVQKYFVENNSYELVRMARTNDNGEDIIPLQLYDVWYRFLVYDNNYNLVFIGSKTKVYSGAYTITISPSTITATLNKFDQITTSLSYDNSTGTFSLIYADSSGSAQQVCMVVYKNEISSFSTVCRECLTSASGTILCTINTTQGGVYTANAYATINPTWILNSVVVEILIDLAKEGFKAKIGKEGLFWTAALSTTMAFAFAFSPVAGLIAAFLGLVASAIMGLINISYVAMATLGVIIGIIAYKMRN